MESQLVKPPSNGLKTPFNSKSYIPKKCLYIIGTIFRRLFCSFLGEGCPMNPEEILREQLLSDMEKLHSLILRYAAGKRKVKQERIILEEGVEVKMALLLGMREKC